MDIDSLIRKFDNKDDQRRTAEEMDEVRHKTLAYEYLCHLEEARIWLEACLKEKLPQTTALEENLRNGVYLAKLGHFISPEILPLSKIYDYEQKRYMIAGLQFRHTDNINHWLKVLKTTELPLTFHPETTDVYDRKNMPRVIYCIHALSTHLFKVGRAPLIQDLYGKATFTDEEIDTMSKELRKYGITMPAFQKIAGLLSSNLEGDLAALHAAVFNVNQVIDSQETILSSLLNPAVKLKYVLRDLVSDYQAILQNAKRTKVQNTLNRSMNDSYVPDVYDELLTQAEIQGYIISVNCVYTIRKAVEASMEKNEKTLYYQLNSEWLQLKYLKHENIDLYMEHMKSLYTISAEVFMDNVGELTKTLQEIINKGNAKAETRSNIDIAVKSVNRALDDNTLKELYFNLMNLRNYSSVYIDEFSLPLLYEEMKLDKMELGKDLTFQDILNSTQVLTSIANISKAVDQCSFEELWEALVNSKLPIEGLHEELYMSYCQTIILARQAKIHANLSCSILTLSDIQDCIDEVNLNEDDTKELINTLNDVNDAVRKDDTRKLMCALNNKKLKITHLLLEENSILCLRNLKVTMKKKCDGELWLDDIQNTISDIAEETNEVLSVCNVLTKVNLSILQINAESLASALEAADIEIVGYIDVYRSLFEDFLAYFENKNSRNQCPWVVHHTKSGKTVYVNIETNSYSWDTPKDFQPNSRYLSMKDIQTLIQKSNKNNIESIKRKRLENIIKLQAYIRGFLIRSQLINRRNFLLSKISEIIKIQAWWRALPIRRRYKIILHEKKTKRKSIKNKPQDLNAYYNSQEKYIVRIQALWRGRCARRAFLSLFHQKCPPFKVVKHFVPLLDFSTEDYEKEILLQTMRAEAVQAIRRNQQLSKQLDELDLQIGLLVQNRISLQDVVAHRTKLNDLVKRNNATLHSANFASNDSKTGTVKCTLSSSTRGLKSLTRESRQLLDGYQHLFYLLQTNPIYLSKLLFCLTQSRTNQFLQNVILTLYNFGSNARDEYLLLKLFRSNLEEEILSRFSRPLDVITGNLIVLKMAVNHARQSSGLGSLRNILGPLVERIVNDKGLSIETSPVEIYKTWRNRMESQTGQISILPHTVTQEQALSHHEVKEKLQQGLQTLKTTVMLFLDRITECKDMLPFSILYMARVLHNTLVNKFSKAPEKDILKVIGHLVYYQFINAAIVAPDAFDIITLPHDKALSNDQRRNLASVAKLLHFSALKKGFGEESAHLECLNEFIIECHEKMKNFFRRCCQGPSLEEHFSVDEYSEATLLYKPVIYISVQEICDTHSLLVEYEDVIAPEVNDRLHELLDALGPTDPGEIMPLATLTPLTNTEVCLTLVDKFQLPSDDMTDINKLFIKTKELCVSVLPFLNGDHLLEALCIGTTKHQQDQYKTYIEQKLYSGMIKPNEKMTLREHISQLRKYLNTLEDEGYVTREDGYQSIVTAIALDLCNKGKYRRGQINALQMMKKTKQCLDQKTKYYEEQCDFYNQYINKCLENLNAGKRVIHSLDRKGGKLPGKVKSKLSVKYSAQKLFEKGILMEIDGLSVSQFKNVLFEITPTDHNGIFNVKGKFLGVEVEKIELDVQHLLQLQYDGCSIINLFGKAKINVNLLLFLLNSKFYGKTK